MLNIQAEIWDKDRIYVKKELSDMVYEEYRFYLRRKSEFILDAYYVYGRKSKRHRYSITARWERLDKRGNSVVVPDYIPEDVILAAKNEWYNSIKFLIEKEK